MTSQAKDSTTNDSHAPTSLTRTESCGAYVSKQLFEFIAYCLFQCSRRRTDKYLRVKRCSQSHDIGCGNQPFFKLTRNRMNLSSNQIAGHCTLGPTLGCQSTHHQNTIDKQGRGFFKPRPCNDFRRCLPLVEHKMRCSCHRARRHDGLKF